MKAVLFREYGAPDLLRVEEVRTPTPEAGEVLVEVHSAAVNPLDWRVVRGRPYFLRMLLGWPRPSRQGLGADLAGRVVAVGPGVTRWSEGDEVFGSTGMQRGAFAQFACAPQEALAARPAEVDAEQAAAVPVAALTALQALRDNARLEAGQRVLVNGASGGVGTFAVQLAKALGASRVTAVCSARNAELVRSVGADAVMDYTHEDFTRGQRHDVVIDCIANRPIAECRRALERDGTYVVVGGPDGRWLGPVAPFLRATLMSPFVSQRLVPCVSRESGEDLAFLASLLRERKLRAVIDRRYRLEEIVDALRHVEAGHARGKVVISLAEKSRLGASTAEAVRLP